MVQELIVKANGKSTKFLGNFSYSKDILDVRAIASFRLSYTDERWKFWKPGLDKVELIGGVTGSGRLFYGHVTRVVKNEEFIDVSLEDMGYRMKATCSSDYQNKTLKEVITQLCKEIEFTPVFDNIPKDILNKK
ncbi:MAG: hypothetical protein LLG05_09135, partial [Porphyromonadaceae bacterium]|nr:hypothetical protein [Porphyromonadaceae bacterium]